MHFGVHWWANNSVVHLIVIWYADFIKYFLWTYYVMFIFFIVDNGILVENFNFLVYHTGQSFMIGSIQIQKKFSNKDMAPKLNIVLHTATPVSLIYCWYILYTTLCAFVCFWVLKMHYVSIPWSPPWPAPHTTHKIAMCPTIIHVNLVM